MEYNFGVGLIEIEFEFGKSFADKLLIWLIHSSIYYPYRFLKSLAKNYSIIRSKSRIPLVSSINFEKSVYPFAIYFILIPSVFLFLISNYIDKDIFILIIIVYAGLVGVVFCLATFYLVYRMLIDLLASTFCLLKSLFKTIKN